MLKILEIVITYPNAKINLGLYVLSRRADGYHNIETIMLPISLCDILEIKPSCLGESEISLSGLEVGGEKTSNLCIRAYNIFCSRHLLPPVNIHLHKIIPSGAGLGGGSADAVFTLQMLNKISGMGLSDEEIREMALEVGSDCPFFLENRPVLATGRGEEMVPLNIDMKGIIIIVVKPSFSINTAMAYKQIDPVSGRVPLKDLIMAPYDKWRENIINDFEPYVLANYEEAVLIKKYLYESGALIVQMSGSGSAFYGLFDRMPLLNGFLEDRLVFNGVLS